MTATAVSTPATVPATQNTAPIIEYRCLYTHDLKRKQKRWQDGLLRFHTFNKRVMVYDVPRNFVGDTHWRDNCLVQDGDEFELDRGVLIQVGEQVGKVEQDISSLLEKRPKAPDVPVRINLSTEQQHVSRSTLSNPAQALRPKSLNAVLGTPKCSIGRSMNPAKSPYDQRQECVMVSRLQESDARQAHLATKIVPSGLETYRPVFRKDHDTQKRPNALETSQVHRTAQNARPASPSIIVQTERDKARARDARSHKSRVSGAERQTIAMASPSSKTASRPASDSNIRPRRHDITEVVPLRSSTAAMPQQIAKNGTHGASNPSLRDHHSDDGARAKPTVRLRMATHEPRKKLMYRELLPASTSPEHMRASTTSDLLSSHALKGAISSAHEPKSLSSLHQDEQERLSERLKRFHDSHPDVDVDEPSEQPRKRQRVSESASNNVRAGDRHLTASSAVNLPIPRARPAESHDTNSVLDRMDEMLMSKAKAPARKSSSREVNAVTSPNVRPVQELAASSDRSHSPAQGPVIPHSASSDIPQPQAKTNTAANEPTKPPTTIRPAQPFNTTTDTTANSPPPTTHDPPPQTQDLLDLAAEDVPLPRNKALPTFKRPARRSPLKKTISDTSSMRPPPEAPVTPIVTSNPPSREGSRSPKAQVAEPWSKEAWDLFGCGRDGKKCRYGDFVGG